MALDVYQMATVDNSEWLVTLLEVRDYARLQANKVSNGFIAREKWHKIEEKIKRTLEGESYQPEVEAWEACRQKITDQEWMQ